MYPKMLKVTNGVICVFMSEESQSAIDFVLIYIHVCVCVCVCRITV